GRRGLDHRHAGRRAVGPLPPAVRGAQPGELPGAAQVARLSTWTRFSLTSAPPPRPSPTRGEGASFPLPPRGGGPGWGGDRKGKAGRGYRAIGDQRASAEMTSLPLRVARARQVVSAIPSLAKVT